MAFSLAGLVTFLHVSIMNTRLIAVGLSLLLVACQTPSSLVGSGPLNLSTSIERYYNERYKPSMGAEYFVVSRDGRFANFTFCPAGSGGCGGRDIVYEVIEGCEKRSGQECFIYAQNGFVVWDGLVTVGDGASISPPPDSDFHLCTQAVSMGQGVPTWTAWSHRQKLVDEAKKRGLSPRSCAELVSAGSAPSSGGANGGPLSDMSNRALCMTAFESGKWSANNRMKEHGRGGQASRSLNREMSVSQGFGDLFSSRSTRVLGIVLLAISLAGCRTTADVTGSGTIVLTHGTADTFQNRYFENVEPRFLLHLGERSGLSIQPLPGWARGV